MLDLTSGGVVGLAGGSLTGDLAAMVIIKPLSRSKDHFFPSRLPCPSPCSSPKQQKLVGGDS